MATGRPSKLSEQRTNAALEALRMGCTREAAAGVAGVHRETLRRWMDDAAFRGEVEKAEQQAEAAYTYSVQAAVPKNWQAAAWWLERRRHESYGRRDRLEMTVDVRGLAEKMAAADGLDTDELIAEAERIFANA
jgi:hypothetical protein